LLKSLIWSRHFKKLFKNMAGVTESFANRNKALYALFATMLLSSIFLLVGGSLLVGSYTFYYVSQGIGVSSIILSLLILVFSILMVNQVMKDNVLFNLIFICAAISIICQFSIGIAAFAKIDDTAHIPLFFGYNWVPSLALIGIGGLIFSIFEIICLIFVLKYHEETKTRVGVIYAQPPNPNQVAADNVVNINS
jgi:hypothetical protein